MVEKDAIQLRTHLTSKQQSREQRYCHHPHITVVEETRLLFCQDCELWIEPFTYMMGWANRDWAAERVAKGWEEDTKRLCEEVLELKRVRRNIKAQIRRLKQKARTDGPDKTTDSDVVRPHTARDAGRVEETRMLW